MSFILGNFRNNAGDKFQKLNKGDTEMETDLDASKLQVIFSYYFIYGLRYFLIILYMG